MASIQLRSIEKWFDDVQVIKGVDLDIAEGEFIVLVGPSGCGKSTLLRILAGLEDATHGSLLINEEDVTDRLPSERGLSMVFQSYALYPHMNVADNIGFALKTAGAGKAEIEERVQAVAKTPAVGGVARAASQTAVRRPAPARRHWPCDHQAAKGLSV